LIKQVEGGATTQKHTIHEKSIENMNEIDRKEDDLQEEDIAHNLPKVSIKRKMLFFDIICISQYILISILNLITIILKIISFYIKDILIYKFTSLNYLHCRYGVFYWN